MVHFFAFLFPLGGLLPDVHTLMRKMSAPSICRSPKGEYAISYLAGTASFCLIFHADNQEEILGWADSSYNSGEGDRRNGYGYCCQLQLGWSSRMFIAVCKYSTLIAQSMTGAEFYCQAETCRDLLWIQSFFCEMGENISCKKTFQDSTSSINMVSHEWVIKRSKHIDVKFHFVMKLKSDSKVEFPHPNSVDMCTDISTKDLSDDVYAWHAAVVQEYWCITILCFQS